MDNLEQEQMLRFMYIGDLKKVDRHELKTLTSYYEAVSAGYKTFEVRKNDRDFKVDDVMILEEYDLIFKYTGNKIYTRITYILDDDRYCKDGMVIIGFRKSFEHRRA